MASLLIDKCGVLFWPQVVLDIAVWTLIIGYLLTWLRGGLVPGTRPWQESLDPLASVAVTLGLFGSVIGFISAFSGFQKGIDVGVLARGLSIAYWTTGVGIVTSLCATLGAYFLSLLSGEK